MRLFELFCCFPYIFDAYFPGPLTHLLKCHVEWKLRNRHWQMFIQGVAMLLINFASLRRILVTMTIVKSWFLHMLSFRFRG